MDFCLVVADLNDCEGLSGLRRSSRGQLTSRDDYSPHFGTLQSALVALSSALLPVGSQPIISVANSMPVFEH